MAVAWRSNNLSPNDNLIDYSGIYQRQLRPELPDVGAADNCLINGAVINGKYVLCHTKLAV